MSNNDVPLLTATIAAELYAELSTPIVSHSLEAIATGRAVVIPRRTEKEWREEFSTLIRGGDTGGLVESRSCRDKQTGFIAALRHVGAIRPDEKEGV